MGRSVVDDDNREGCFGRNCEGLYRRNTLFCIFEVIPIKNDRGNLHSEENIRAFCLYLKLVFPAKKLDIFAFPLISTIQSWKSWLSFWFLIIFFASVVFSAEDVAERNLSFSLIYEFVSSSV